MKNVDEKTAGIIPYDIHSKALGRLTLYDFAGHKEYYAGHDALHSTIDKFSIHCYTGSGHEGRRGQDQRNTPVLVPIY